MWTLLTLPVLPHPIDQVEKLTHWCILLDAAISHIITFGPGTVLAKIDIKHAFRLLPVHPADRHVLAMHWNNNIYIDTCLPFGLRSAP